MLMGGGRIVRPILAVVAAIALGAIAVAGCGGDDEEEPQGRDLTAVYCPMVPSGERVEGQRQYEPAEDALDTAELIGMTLDEARATAGEHGCSIVVSFKDGRGRPVPIDIDPTRIYVYTEDDVVTEIEGVGGGI
jgi:hypothetical protein